jgi:beta-xylosidase
VAVADRVTGPYHFAHSLRPDAGVWPANATEETKTPLDDETLRQLGEREFRGGAVENYPPDTLFRRDFADGQMARDMTLFVDDDGAAYHIHASEENGTLHISRLSDDYLTSGGRYIRIFPGRFHEAPAMMKRHGKYFLITSGCTGWAPNAARLSVADSIWGPWRELGNPCRGDEKQTATTFDSQSTFILPVAHLHDAFIFMADRWCPENAIDGRYLWLPVRFDKDIPFLEWQDEWNLEFFAR